MAAAAVKPTAALNISRCRDGEWLNWLPIALKECFLLIHF
jgi:hypothetical protein